MDQQKIFILPRIGSDLSLKVTEAVIRLYGSLSWLSPGRINGGRNLGP